jgi:hypothetical protein
MKMDQLKSIADCPAFQVGLQAGEFEPVKDEGRSLSFYLFRGFHSACRVRQGRPSRTSTVRVRLLPYTRRPPSYSILLVATAESMAGIEVSAGCVGVLLRAEMRHRDGLTAAGSTARKAAESGEARWEQLFGILEKRLGFLVPASPTEYCPPELRGTTRRSADEPCCRRVRLGQHAAMLAVVFATPEAFLAALGSLADPVTAEAVRHEHEVTGIESMHGYVFGDVTAAVKSSLCTWSAALPTVSLGLSMHAFLGESRQDHTLQMHQRDEVVWLACQTHHNQRFALSCALLLDLSVGSLTVYCNGSNAGCLVSSGLLGPLDWAVSLRCSSPNTRTQRRLQQKARSHNTRRAIIDAAEKACEQVVTSQSTPADKSTAAQVLRHTDANTRRSSSLLEPASAIKAGGGGAVGPRQLAF